MDIKDLFDIDELKMQVIERATSELLDSIKYDAKQQVLQQVQSTISQHINQVVVEALSDTYQPIDDYGEETGPKTTLRKEFKKAVVQWWQANVDDEGEPSNRWNGKPRYQWVAAKVIGDVLDHRLKDQFGKLVQESRELVKQGIADLVAEKITQVWSKRR